MLARRAHGALDRVCDLIDTLFHFEERFVLEHNLFRTHIGNSFGVCGVIIQR
jgi:hypothetical protein